MEDGALPQGLTIQNAYTELQKGSKYVVVVVRNSTAYSQMLQKKALVDRVMAATVVQKYYQRSGCEKGMKNLRILIHLMWWLDKGKVSCLKN